MRKQLAALLQAEQDVEHQVDEWASKKNSQVHNLLGNQQIKAQIEAMKDRIAEVTKKRGELQSETQKNKEELAGLESKLQSTSESTTQTVFFIPLITK